VFKRDWRLFVTDILKSINKIERYVESITFEQFIGDDMRRDAVVRNLEIIGEAANQIPEEIQERYSDIPWKSIIGFRNRLAHGYFVIDYKIVWEIVKNDIPLMKRKMEMIEVNKVEIE